MLIAGAGPAGLLLAADLATSGVRVTVLSCGSEPCAWQPASASVTLNARSLEHLDALGMADAVISTGQPLGQVSVWPGVSVDLTRLPSRFPLALVVPWHQVQRVLAARAASLGARIVCPGNIAEVSQNAAATRLSARAPAGAERTFAAPYLVGADGAGRAVLAALGRPPGFVHGRIILAGAAARPPGPPGQDQDLNAGLQDAANLGWRLAAVLRSGAGHELLGSYQDERGQAARRQARTLRSLTLPARAGSRLPGRALTAVAARAMRGGPAADLTARALSGLSGRYRLGQRSHPLAGRRAPDMALTGPHVRLYQALRERRPILLISAALRTSTEVPPLLALWAERVIVAGTGEAPALLTLVRPDGYIGWASDSGSPARRYAELRQALWQYCGPPAVGAREPARR